MEIPLVDNPETLVETIWSKKFGFEAHPGPQVTKVLGVEFVPINTPWKRRVETLAIVLWFLSMVFSGPIILLGLIVSLFTPLFWISLAYFIWYFYDIDTPNRGGRTIPWVRKLDMWRQFANYFPIRLVKTSNLNPSKNYLFCSHPHGVICYGAFGSFSTDALGFSEKFPGLTPHMLTLNFNLRFPVHREYVMALGTCAVSRKSINTILCRPEGGQVAVVVPGGVKEMIDARTGNEYILYLKERKGFVKLALQNGAPLVPVFSFGENQVFDQLPNKEGSLARKIQNFFYSLFGIAPIFILGRGIFQYTFGILPRRYPITVVVGPPLEFDKIVEPTREQVDTLHEKYVHSLMTLFEKYKRKYGTEDSYLTII